MKFLLTISIILFANVNAALIPSDSQVILNIGSATKQTLPNKKLQVLVWNLHKGADKTFEKDFKILARNKDLILTQEFYLNPKMEQIFSQLSDYMFATATSFFMSSEEVRTGVATASPVSAITTNFLRTINREPFLQSPKMALITQYPIENSTEYLTVINLHAINFVTAKTFNEEIEQIDQLAVKLKITRSPLLIAGDFNTWSKERIKILNNFKDKLQLDEATFFPDNRITFNSLPLDHVYYSKELELISAKSDSFYQGSDHKPLELNFNIKNQR
jgi:endonuclease/exonuclease/phosphatase (EEP) superfamily protein YafD